ncbi:peptide-binding protein [Hydrococcus rivularis NIES-593]|uniref:Peptide-binding protein n=1 Tax=Hydrococcus rivularis NIES-593 TaxID=1921803 RepID=A0A1U7H888_9CYAN|nr:SH3 domain-containing protein [Hydrococcus rivularis]OKH18999.1 peptide-binding protein [Hydrococcus rivularis NIES-593]
MRRIANIFQFLIGFFLGILVLAGGTTAAAYVFFTKMSANPPKPIFAEEKQENTAATQPQQPTVAESSSPDSSDRQVQEDQQDELPAGAYKARVTWSEGLSLRSEPSREAKRVGGVDYNAELIVLQDSIDKQWQKVRLLDGTQEGWVKAGNVEKIAE